MKMSVIIFGKNIKQLYPWLLTFNSQTLLATFMNVIENTISPIDFKAELNKEQFAAVTAPNGPALVLAGAGSGKTRTLTYRVAYLLTQNVRPWEILLLTFTNKAAKEMLSRVEVLTQTPAHQFWGGTFHHIGQKLLRMHGKPIGITPSFTIMDASDAESLLSNVIQIEDSKYLKNKDHPKASVLANIISYSRNTFQSASSVLKKQYPFFSDLAEKVERFKKGYQARKIKEQVLDYDDLLELWFQMLKEDPIALEYCQNKFKHILVDEYQDTNKLQSGIIDLMSVNHQIMAVGDDAQCIYTWRGADFENIINFSKRHPGNILHKIETNYRSTPDILDFANAIPLYSQVNAAYRKNLKSVRKANRKPMVVSASDTYRQAAFIIKRIKGLLQEGYKSSDIAVLYRAHYHAMDLQMEFSKNGIPYVITSGVRFFEQAHIRDLVAQLRFAHNSDDTIAFGRIACLLPKIGPKTAERLLKLANKESNKQKKSIITVLTSNAIMEKVPELVRDDWTDMAITLQDIEECMKPPYADNTQEEDLFSMSINKTQASFTPKSPGAVLEIAINGWYGDYLRNIYTNWSARQDDLESLIAFGEKYDDMSELLAQLVLLNSESSNNSTEVDEECVRLTTIHQSKGLEFPIVFVIGLSEGQFPLKRAVEEDNLDEERRLFYVASTRAKDELYLSHPMINMQGNSGPVKMEMSRFIREVPEELYEHVELKGHRANSF